MIESLSYITFVVRDLDRMSEILTGVFDAREIYDSGARQFSLSHEKFFLIGDLWIAIMQGEPLTEPSYNHIAFKIDDADFDRYAERVRRLGIDMRPPRPRAISAPVTTRRATSSWSLATRSSATSSTARPPKRRSSRCASACAPCLTPTGLPSPRSLACT
nr:VOC family protein [Mesorhizobium sp.]